MTFALAGLPIASRAPQTMVRTAAALAAVRILLIPLQRRFEIIPGAPEVRETDDEERGGERRRVGEPGPLRREAVEERALIRDDHSGYRVQIEELALGRAVREALDREQHRRHEVPGRDAD